MCHHLEIHVRVLLLQLYAHVCDSDHIKCLMVYTKWHVLTPGMNRERL